MKRAIYIPKKKQRELCNIRTRVDFSNLHGKQNRSDDAGTNLIIQIRYVFFPDAEFEYSHATESESDGDEYPPAVEFGW